MEQNLSKFNLTRFNLGDVRDIYISAHRDANITVEAVAGGKRTVSASPRLARIIVDGRASPHILVKAARNSTITVGSYIEMYVKVLRSKTVTITVNAEAYAAKKLWSTRNSIINVASDVYVGKVIRKSRSASTVVKTNVHIGKIMFSTRSGLFIVDARADLGLIRYQDAVIDVIIPPGGEIRIDSSVFTAMMGQVNILHLYRGDWITFDRDTIQLRVESGSGGQIVGDVLYNDRYI